MHLLLAVAVVGALSDPTQEHKLTADGAQASDCLGQAVAMDGATVVSGDICSGAAYVFDAVTGDQVTQLTPSDGLPGDQFGHDVGVSGGVAIVGAHKHSGPPGQFAGAAYLFDSQTGIEVRKLVSDDIAANDEFGEAVAIDGGVAVVGARGSRQSGAAYVFDTASGQQLWKLTPDDAVSNSDFGNAVAIAGSTIVVGAIGAFDGGSRTGAAYVFDANTGLQVVKLLADDGLEGDNIGYSVATDGLHVLVGGYKGSNGSAYLFDAATGGQVAKLEPDDLNPATGPGYGRSVSVSGGLAIVGADGDDEALSGAGAAYLFDTQTGQQVAKMFAGDPSINAGFGTGVAIDNETAAVGSPDANGPGATYVFTVSNPITLGEWTDLGGGASGVAGDPTLQGSGFLLADTILALSLANAAALAVAPLVIGVSDLSAPFKGGVLIPHPDFIVPMFTDFAGEADLSFLWPQGVPSGGAVYFQWWVQDGGAQEGFAGSNGLKAQAP